MTKPDTQTWISALRNSQDRFAAVLEGMSDDQVRQQSYADEWTIADTASHLGSQAEIFERFLTAGLTGQPTPEMADFQAIWDRWNALDPAEQVRQSVATGERFVAGIEQLSPEDAERFQVSMFGSDADLATAISLRLGEQALHGWDIAVTLDPGAILPLDAVEPLLTTLGRMAGRAGKPTEGAGPIRIATVAPTAGFELSLSPAVSLTAAEVTEADLTLPGEALIRLVSGRLDPEHTPAGIEGEDHLDQLRTAFPGL